MRPTLRRFFHLEEGEGAKLLPFALLGLVLQAGLTMGMNGADSAFLVVAGAARLPHIYMALPVIMLGYVPIYAALMGRWGIDRVFDCTLGLLAAGGIALWWFSLGRGDAAPLALCYAAKLWTALWYVGLYTLYWNFIDGYFNLFDAKRLFALLGAGSALGATIGGALVGPVTAQFGVASLFLIWAGCAVLAWPIARWARQRSPKLDAAAEEAEEPAALRRPGRLLGLLLRTRYALVLTLVLFFTLIAATVCEFQYLGIFSAGRDEAHLAALLGRLSAAVNLFNLAVGLFFFNRLVAWLGVRNVALLQSGAYAAVFSWLLLDGGFPAAVAGFFAFQGLMTSIDFNNANLLFAGLPTQLAKQMRTLIEGLAEPVATATAGLFLLLVALRLSPEQISLAGVVVSLAGLLLVFVLRYDYVAAIGANLRRGWLDLALSPEPLLKTAAPDDLKLAEERSRTASPADAAVALRLLWIGDPLRAGRALVDFLRRAPEGSLAPVRPLLDEALADPGSEVPHEIQRWLAEPGAAPTAELSAELGRHHLLPLRRTEKLLHDAEPGARGAGAVALWQSWRVADSREALRQVDQLLAAGEPAAVAAGLRALGLLGQPRYAYRLRDYLRSPDAAVRHAALSALRELAGPATRIILPELLEIVPRVAGEERLLALEAFERIGDSAGLATLLDSADGFTPAERRRAERAIVQLGPGTVPVLLKVAHSRRAPLMARSIALRALGKLALPQAKFMADAVVRQLAQRSYLFLSGYLALAGEGAEANAEPGRAVQARIFREYPGVALELILETLMVSGQLADFETLMAALRGGASKERGYAIETIEQACTPDLFRLLLPLLDGRPPEAQVAFAFGQQLIPRLTATEVITRTFETGAPLASAAAGQALAATAEADMPNRLLARLSAFPHPLIAGTVVTLLARRAGRDGQAPTPVEQVHAFMAAAEFSACKYPQHEFLAPHVQHVRLPAGTVLAWRGSKLPGVWLVRSGQVQAEAGCRLGPGSLVGGEAVQRLGKASVDLIVDRDLEAFYLPIAAWRRCLEVFPELGLSLLAQKLAA